MNEFDDIPFLSADEILCYLGIGMLAAGIVAGLLFAVVPLARPGMRSLRDTWFSKRQNNHHRMEGRPLLVVTLT